MARRRSGYALVIFCMTCLAIMVNQVSSQSSAELYSLTMWNQYQLDHQMRWAAEGILNYHSARCVKAGSKATTIPAFNGFFATYSPPNFPPWYTAGRLWKLNQSSAVALQIKSTNTAIGANQNLGAHVICLSWPGGSVLCNDRMVGRQDLQWNLGAWRTSAPGNPPSTGLYLRDQWGNPNFP